MKTENTVLMQEARASLSGKWGLAIGTMLVFILILGVIQAVPKMGPFISLFVTGAFSLGIATFALNIARNKEARLEDIFSGFQNFGTALGAYLLMIIYILLWTLLLIIPGIIAALAYSMTFYILADDRSISATEALAKSKKMMEGYKWKYFRMGLRFLGLSLLCLLTLGIAFFWLMPFMQVTMAKFYDDIKTDASEVIVM